MAKLSYKKKRQLMAVMRWTGGLVVVGGLVYGMVKVAEDVGEKEKAFDAFAESVAEKKHQHVVAEASEVPEDARFAEAMALVAAGDEDGARAILREIAPPRAAGVRAIGYVPAHLWLGLDLVRPAVVSDAAMLVGQSPLLTSLRGNDLAGVDAALVERATNHFRAVDELAPERPEGALWLAELAAADGRSGDALVALMDAVTRSESPQSGAVVALVNVARMLPQDGPVYQDLWHTFALLGNEAQQRPGDLDVRLDYAASALVLRRYDVCAVILEKMRSDFYDSKRYPGAQLAYDALRMGMEYSQALDAMGENGDPDLDAAARHLCAALRCLPQDLALVDVAGAFGSEHAGQRGAVADLFAEVVVMEGLPDAVFGRMRRYLGVWAQEAGELDVAREQLVAAADAAPADALAMVALARNARALGEVEAAYELAGQAVELARDPEVLFGVAHPLRGELAYELKRWPEVISDLEKALEHSSNPQRLHLMLAEAYAAVGDDELAERHRAKGE